MIEGKVEYYQDTWGKIRIRATAPESGGELAFFHNRDVVISEKQKECDSKFISQKYKSLTRKYKDQPENEYFAFFPWGRGETWETPYEALAQMAKYEEWNFKAEEFRKDYKQRLPILTNYLNYTFMRAQELDLIAFSIDESKACFNTGLQTEKDKDIYATFHRQKEVLLNEGDLVEFELTRNDQGLKAISIQKKDSRYICKDKWVLNSFEDSYSDRLKPFRHLPELPTYITDASDLVFDVHYEIDVNFDHIIDERDNRLPAIIRENQRLAIAAIEGAVKALKSQVIRNYKIAIPHWYRGKVQLLLPLKITSDDRADLALVADKDKDRGMYRIRTVLTMDKAFINARLITRPDRDWLDP